MNLAPAVADHCRQTLAQLDEVRDLPALSGLHRDVLNLHRIQVQNIVHTLEVSS